MKNKNAIYESLYEILKNKRQQIIILTTVSLIINLSYSLYNTLFGIMQKSIWFITTGIYYAILSIMRLIAVKGELKQNKEAGMLKEISIMKTTGIMLFILTFTLTGSICLSLKYDLAKSYGTIMMITIATYTFPKIIIAVHNLIKARKYDTPLIITIRNISISDALVSMLSMQMSMFATFGKGETDKSYTMNVITGAVVCLCIVIIGLLMIYHSKKMNKNINKIGQMMENVNQKVWHRMEDSHEA